jgi:hypothetical protein
MFTSEALKAVSVVNWKSLDNILHHSSKNLELKWNLSNKAFNSPRQKKKSSYWERGR